MTCFWVSHNLQSDFSSFLHILVDMSPSNGDPGLSIIFFWDPKPKWNTFDFPLAFWTGRWQGLQGIHLSHERFPSLVCLVDSLIDWLMRWEWDVSIFLDRESRTKTFICDCCWVRGRPVVAIDGLDLPSVSTTLWEKDNCENHPLTYHLKSQKYMTWQRQRDFGRSLHINQWE